MKFVKMNSKDFELILIKVLLGILVSGCTKETDPDPAEKINGRTTTQELFYISDSSIYSIDKGGNNTTKLTSIDLEHYFTIDYSNQTKTILYSSELPNRSGPGELFTMRITGENKKRITNNNINVTTAALSNDASKIAFYTFPGNNSLGELMIINSDGSGQSKISFPANIEAYEIWDLCWNNENDILLMCGKFQETGRSFESGVFTLNIKNTSLIKLLGDSLDPSEAKFSPDESEIALIGTAYFGHGNIYKMTSNGTQVQQLTSLKRTGTNVKTFDVSWSSNGTQLIFTSDIDQFSLFGFDEKSLEIYTIHQDGSGLKRLTNDTIANFSPHWIN
jgi:Tol biopolymer transport system component